MKKIVSIILAVVLLAVAIPTIPTLLKTDIAEASDAQATSNPTYKTSITADTYAAGATTDTYNAYSLLEDATQAISLKKGDVWTVSAYVTYRSSQRPADSSLKAEIGFSLLGNNEAHGDVSVYNGHFYYLGSNASSGEAELLSPDTVTYYDWQDGWGWKVKFIVKPYESVTLYMTNASDVVKWDKTIAWSELYRLKDITAASEPTFNPSFVFQNTDAEVSDISVEYVAGAETGPSYVTSLTADTYTAGATADTYKVYSLLDASSERVQLQKGDVWTVSAYVMYRSPQRPEGSSLKAEIGFSLLGNEEAHGDVSVYNGNFHYLGINASSGEAEMISPDTTWNDWQDGWGWKVKFTVKPYESVTLYMTNASDVLKWDKTIAWNELYRLQDITEASGATFNPSFVFQNTDAEVSDISVEYVAKEEMGPSYVTSLTADTYTAGATEDTYKVYSLLDASSESVKLQKGDVWTVSAYVMYRSPQRPADSSLKAEIGFSLLGNEEAHGDVSVYNGHFHYLGTNASSGEAELILPEAEVDNFYNWEDGWGWNVKFTVKPYESVTLWMANGDATAIKYNVTMDWNDLYRLKDITAESGQVFYPSFVFQNTDAEVSNIVVTHTSMLELQAQSRVNPTNPSNTDIRFVSSVDNAEDYSEAGFVFSLTNKTPEVNGAGCATRNTTTVYEKIYADGALIDAKTAGYDYSEYMYVKGLSNFTTGMKIYARAYVKLVESGAIVYGDVVEINVTGANVITKN